MKLLEALHIATTLVYDLQPHCDRIEIAGSCRRQKAEVKDIEIVCIPKPFEVGLFESGIATVVNQWEKVKGDITPQARYTQRKIRYKEGKGFKYIKLDLFICTPFNWGLIMVYRTGSAEFNMMWLQEAKARGYDMREGNLFIAGRRDPTAVYEERDLFGRIGMDYVEPRNRH